MRCRRGPRSRRRRVEEVGLVVPVGCVAWWFRFVGPGCVAGGVGFGVVVGAALRLGVSQAGGTVFAVGVGVVGLEPVVRGVASVGGAAASGFDEAGGAYPFREPTAGVAHIEWPAVLVKDEPS